jgi:hypothetical protein
MAVKDLTEIEARELLRSGLGREFRQIAAASSAPIFWFTPPPDDIARILNFGTVSLVHTGERLLGITADHVVSAFLEARGAHPGLVLQVGHAALPLQERIIARSGALDLCTFSVSEAEAKRIGGRF